MLPFNIMKTATLTPETTVYAAAAWWADCDLAATVISQDPRMLKTALRFGVSDEVRSAVAGGRFHSAVEARKALLWSDVVPIKIGEITLSGRQRAALLRALRHGRVAVFPAKPKATWRRPDANSPTFLARRGPNEPRPLYAAKTAETRRSRHQG